MFTIRNLKCGIIILFAYLSTHTKWVFSQREFLRYKTTPVDMAFIFDSFDHDPLVACMRTFAICINLYSAGGDSIVGISCGASRSGIYKQFFSYCDMTYENCKGRAKNNIDTYTYVAENCSSVAGRDKEEVVIENFEQVQQFLREGKQEKRALPADVANYIKTHSENAVNKMDEARKQYDYEHVKVNGKYGSPIDFKDEPSGKLNENKEISQNSLQKQKLEQVYEELFELDSLKGIGGTEDYNAGTYAIRSFTDKISETTKSSGSDKVIEITEWIEGTTEIEPIIVYDL